jgi:hypothetical protein
MMPTKKLDDVGLRRSEHLGALQPKPAPKTDHQTKPIESSLSGNEIPFDKLAR